MTDGYDEQLQPRRTPATPRIAFVDTETLGLDPDQHAIWEVGLVLYDPGEHRIVDERLWQIALADEQIAAGDPVGMGIGRFDERYDPGSATPVREFLADFIAATGDSTHLAGAVVSFDEERLRRLARHHGFAPGWHYHLIDVEAVAVGALAARGAPPPLPWVSDDLGAALGVNVADEDRHTALGDARWAFRFYKAATRAVSADAP